MGKLNWAVTGDSMSLSDLSLPTQDSPSATSGCGLPDVDKTAPVSDSPDQCWSSGSALHTICSARLLTDDPGYGVRVCGAAHSGHSIN